MKQWDAALDSRTRDSHARVDGEIREEDEKFSNGLLYPGDPAGSAEEVINCRCVALSRARWALDESELETLKERATYFGLDKTKNFEEYEKKYLKTTAKIDILDGYAAARESRGNFEIIPLPKENVEKKAKAIEDTTIPFENSENDAKIILKSTVVEDAIKSGAVSVTINPDKQARHIKGSAGYIEDKSYIYGTLEDAQKLVDELSGTGEPVMSKGKWQNKERVESEKVIGVHIDPATKEETETKKALIIYSKTGSHIFPRK